MKNVAFSVDKIYTNALQIWWCTLLCIGYFKWLPKSTSCFCPWNMHCWQTDLEDNTPPPQVTGLPTHDFGSHAANIVDADADELSDLTCMWRPWGSKMSQNPSIHSQSLYTPPFLSPGILLYPVRICLLWWHFAGKSKSSKYWGVSIGKTKTKYW